MPSSLASGKTGIFFYLAATVADADALVKAQALAALNNGMLTSVSKSIFEDADATTGPWPDATANGGSERTRLLFRNDLRQTSQMTLPFRKQNVSKVALEAVLEDAVTPLYNEFGELLGELVSDRGGQVADGA
jgi:hypothetical protein